MQNHPDCDMRKKSSDLSLKPETLQHESYIVNQLLVDDNENEKQYDGIDDYELNTPGEWWIATHPHVVTGEIFIKANWN